MAFRGYPDRGDDPDQGCAQLTKCCYGQNKVRMAVALEGMALAGHVIAYKHFQ